MVTQTTKILLLPRMKKMVWRCQKVQGTIISLLKKNWKYISVKWRTNLRTHTWTTLINFLESNNSNTAEQVLIDLLKEKEIRVYWQKIKIFSLCFIRILSISLGKKEKIIRASSTCHPVRLSIRLNRLTKTKRVTWTRLSWIISPKALCIVQNLKNPTIRIKHLLELTL